MSIDIEDLPEIDPFDPDTQRDMANIVARLHEGGHWLARTPLWFTVLSYSAARDLWKDDRFATPVPAMLELQGITDGIIHDRASSNLFAREGDDHSRIRRLVSPAFTPRSVDRLRPMMREYLHARIEPVLESGTCEFVATVAESYPIAVICELLGAPREDWPRFSRWADSILKHIGFDVVTDRPEIERAYLELEDYLDGLIDERIAAPGEDLLSQLVAESVDGDRLSRVELTDVVASMLIGGTDTTRNQLGLAVMLFARHPEQWARLADHPDEVRAAVDEVLRFDSTASGTVRVAKEEVVYRDMTFPAGSIVNLSSLAANRDPEVVECPQHFDSTARRDGWTSLSFGTGRHYCLGANLARAELDEALTVLPASLRNLRIVGEPEMKPYMGIYGPTRLQIAFDPS